MDFHTARLELYSDGRFELEHTITDPTGGLRTLMRGAYRRDAAAIVLAVTEGDRRRWWGDGHRFQHGEAVPYCEWTEPLTAGDRTLPLVATDAGRPAVRVDLAPISTELARVVGDEDPPPCASQRPSYPRGSACATPPRR